MFLKLTDALVIEGGNGGNLTWVNMDKVTSFCRVALKNQTALFVDGEENPLMVVETPEEIISMMNLSQDPLPHASE